MGRLSLCSHGAEPVPVEERVPGPRPPRDAVCGAVVAVEHTAGAAGLVAGAEPGGVYVDYEE